MLDDFHESRPDWGKPSLCTNPNKSADTIMAFRLDVKLRSDIFARRKQFSEERRLALA